jgi:hypothetical protein
VALTWAAALGASHDDATQTIAKRNAGPVLLPRILAFYFELAAGAKLSRLVKCPRAPPRYAALRRGAYRATSDAE